MRHSRIAVIGAGIVGLAVAQEMSSMGHEVWIIEKQSRIGSGISSRNSEVLHAGIYYKPNSLKAKLCVEGNDRIRNLMRKNEIVGSMIGKFIVACEKDEEQKLEEILKISIENGTAPLSVVSCTDMKKLQPNVRAFAALWSPGTGIIDAHNLMSWCLKNARKNGSELLLQHKFVGARKTSSGWSISIRQPDEKEIELECDVVINAAGLLSDKIANSVKKIPHLPAHKFVKGSYFEITKNLGIKNLIYPTPRPNLVGLGTHLTLDLSGQARLGPDVENAIDENDFAVDPQRKEAFLKSASRFLPNLRLEDLRPAYAGIRPKLSTSVTEDFYIKHEIENDMPGWVNLVGIESPGLTASLALASYVSKLVFS